MNAKELLEKDLQETVQLNEELRGTIRQCVERIDGVLTAKTVDPLLMLKVLEGLTTAVQGGSKAAEATARLLVTEGSEKLEPTEQVTLDGVLREMRGGRK